MKKILVYGYKAAPFGGVERVLTEYFKAIYDWRESLAFDVLVAGDYCEQEAALKKVNCHVLYFPRRQENLKAYQIRMKEIFAQTRYDAIWCNVSGLTNIDVLVMAKQNGVPVRVVHSHVSHLMWGNAIMRVLVPLMHYRNKLRLTKYATHYWACSPEAGKFMFPASVYNQIYVVKNAVDTDVYYPRHDVRAKLRQQFGFDGLVLCHTARFSPEKNQKFLLQIMRKVADRDPKAKLLLVGDGELRDELEEEAARLRLEKQVVFTGFRTDVADLLQAADVFVLPSLAEGLGLSAIEAQACGIPCVLSSAVPREADISGAVCFIPVDDSVDQWADAVFEMAARKIDDPIGCVRDAGYDISATVGGVYKLLGGE